MIGIGSVYNQDLLTNMWYNSLSKRTVDYHMSECIEDIISLKRNLRTLKDSYGIMK